MRNPNRPYQLSIFLAVATVGAFWIDLPIAEYSRRDWVIGDLRKLLDVSEVFAHGFGVGLILLTVLVLDPAHRRHVPRVAVCAFGAGLIAQAGKFILPRIRPQAFDFQGDVFSSFVYFRDSATDLTGRAIQSFPSGHTATAVGLAVGLSWLYPRGRWLFLIFAVLAAGQRVESSAHFVSDTLAAAAVGFVVAGLIVDPRVLGRRFNRFEGRRPVDDNLPVSESSLNRSDATRRSRAA